MIHGFTGNPEEVSFIKEALQRCGYEVVTPLLAGHSYATERMPTVAAAEWIEPVEDIVKEGLRQHRDIHMVGFSMGAMIAAILTQRYALPSLVLLSPAVFVVTPHLLFARSKRAARLLLEGRAKVKRAIQDNFVATRSTPMHNLIQFRKLVRQGRAIIPEIHSPVCIIHGLKDDIVDPKSSAWIMNTISSKEKQFIQLPRSGHFICQDIEASKVIDAVTRFVKKHAQRYN